MGMVIAGCGSAAPETTSAAAPPTAAASTSASPFKNVANAETAFVGDAVCATCHEDLYASYQAHGMAQSMYLLTEDREVEPETGTPVYDEAGNFSYTVVRRDSGFYQVEQLRDASGDVIHELARRMEVVVGSGSAARTYLTEVGGRYHQLPLTWYTQVEKWDFSPGYDQANDRFNRLIPDRCMACHNSYPQSTPHVTGKYVEVPQGIGCERCHGPGELHVEARLADEEAGGDIDYTIVNPKHLDLDRRLDVCQQCHLHTTVSMLREGRTALGYRPSQALSDHVALFAEEVDPKETVVSVISHADRMKASACFVETIAKGGVMECTTCHNPHEGFRDSGPDYFNSTCQGCHQTLSEVEWSTPSLLENHLPTANCIDCHMPKVEADDAPHSSFTDHWVRVVEEAPADVEPQEVEDLKAYFAEDRGSASGAIYKARAEVVYALQKGDADALLEKANALQQALGTSEAFDEARYLLGFTLLQVGEVERAIPELEAALRANPEIPERLNTLAQAYEAGQRDATRTERLYRRALQIQPALANIRVNLGRFLEARGRLDEAISTYRQAIEEQPWLVEAHYNLGTALLQKEQLEAGEASLRAALGLNPKYPDALTNLGLLSAMRGDLAGAETLFKRAVEVGPMHAPSLNNLATFYLNQDQHQEAIPLLERAVEANPTFVDALGNLALAYFRAGDEANARTYAQRALAEDATHALSQQIMGAL
ncbi:MAG: tetratricopeptide repeat protein [Bacteroidota bacterium]